MLTTLRIIDTTTGSVDLREFASAAEARRTLGRELGRLVVWERDEVDWVAEVDGVEYRVEADAASVQVTSDSNQHS